jgi:methyltransferase OMS1, mitochondrial
MILQLIAQAAFLFSHGSKQGSPTHTGSCVLWLSDSNNEVNDSIRRRMLTAAVGVVSPLMFNQCGSTTAPANALTPKEAASAYDSYASHYDALDGGTASTILGLDDARAELFRRATGNVLEIGVGTGLNLAKYDTSLVTSLTVVDVSEGMIREARTRADSLNMGIPVRFVTADATSELINIFGVDSFDTVVDSFSLCVMGDVGARKCLEQMAAVVKPSTGRILLLENSRSYNPGLGWYQDITATTAALAGGKGCMYNQDVASMILETNVLQIEDDKAFVAGLFRSFECSKDR